MQKVLDKIQHSFKTKTLKTLYVEGNLKNNVAIYNKPTINITLNVEELKAILINSETRKGCPLSPLSTQHSPESSIYSN